MTTPAPSREGKAALSHHQDSLTLLLQEPKALVPALASRSGVFEQKQQQIAHPRGAIPCINSCINSSAVALTVWLWRLLCLRFLMRTGLIFFLTPRLPNKSHLQCGIGSENCSSLIISAFKVMWQGDQREGWIKV